MAASTNLHTAQTRFPVSNDQPLTSKSETWKQQIVKIAAHFVTIAALLVLLSPASYAFPVLRFRDRDPHVSVLQQRLNDLGYPVAVDSDFGGQTEQAVRDFQRSRGLAVDGVVGTDTACALGLADPRLGFSDCVQPPQNSSGSLGRKFYNVIVPMDINIDPADIRRCAGSRSAVRTPLGSYVNVGSYRNRATAERLSSSVRRCGLRDAHVRYF
jgi:peptidoglycan hydrolase-like protein with peptidoglycan-binding domain